MYREQRIHDLVVLLNSARTAHKDTLRAFARKCSEVRELREQLAKYEGNPS
jgi:hypothetical protein